MTLLPPLAVDCLLPPPVPMLNPPAAGAAGRPGAKPPPCGGGGCCCIGAPKPVKAGAGAEGGFPNGGTGDDAPLPKPPKVGPEVDVVVFDIPNAKVAGAAGGGLVPKLIAEAGVVVLNDVAEATGAEGAPNEKDGVGVDELNADEAAGVVPADDPNENEGAGDGPV